MTTADHIARHTMPEPNSGCLLWIGQHDSHGYGVLRVRHPGRVRIRSKAHRAVWKHVNGPIPRGLHVLHRCDTPICVNPDHLFLGTNRDNMKDAARKGRLNYMPGILAGRKAREGKRARKPTGRPK